MKRLLASAVLLICFFAAGIGLSIANAQIMEPYFKDVLEGNSYFTSIQYLRGDGLIENSEYFEPEAEITKAEAVFYIFKILLGYEPKNKSITEKPFSDVPKNGFLTPYIKEAKELKIVNGNKDKKFQPHKKVNLAEAVKIALETEKLIDLDIKFEQSEEKVFEDIEMDSWIAPYAKIAKEKHIIKFGKDDKMYPSEIVTKGYLMEILYRIIKSREGYKFGIASFYGKKFEGRKTSSGEIFSKSGFTAAHRKLAFGTKIKVINLKNSKSIEVVINDRGPYTKNFVLDLAQAAFEAIAPKSNGIIPVQYIILSE